MSGFKNSTAYGVGYDGNYTSGVVANDGVAPTITQGAIAAYYNGGNNFDGGIGEIIAIFDYDQGIREKVEGYLAWKWGLVGNLDANHPYKHSPPYR